MLGMDGMPEMNGEDSSAKMEVLKSLINQMYSLMNEGQGDEAIDPSQAVEEATEVAEEVPEAVEEMSDDLDDDFMESRNKFMKGERPRGESKSLTIIGMGAEPMNKAPMGKKKKKKGKRY
jgi:hypothetical protein